MFFQRNTAWVLMIQSWYSLGLLAEAGDLLQGRRPQQNQRMREHVEDRLLLDGLADVLGDLEHRLADVEDLQVAAGLGRQRSRTSSRKPTRSVPLMPVQMTRMPSPRMLPWAPPLRGLPTALSQWERAL